MHQMLQIAFKRTFRIFRYQLWSKVSVLFPFLFFLISVLHPNNAGRPVGKKGNVLSPFQTLSPSWRQPLLVLGCFFWLGCFMYFSVLSGFILTVPGYTWFSWWPLWPEMDVRPMLTKWKGSGSPFSYPPCYNMDLFVMLSSSFKFYLACSQVVKVIIKRFWISFITWRII